MSRLRTSANLITSIPTLKNNNSNIKIVYHNSRSLHFHIKDLKADHNICNADIIAITESRLNNSDSQNTYVLPGYQMYRFDDMSFTGSTGRSCKGTVIYSKTDLTDYKNCHINNIETTIVKFNHKHTTVQLVIIYCSPRNATIATFKSFIEHLLQLLNTDTPILIMGDTNIDFNSQLLLSPILQKHNFQQVMTKETTDYHSCLDHVYVKNVQDNFSVDTLESYYSDHKPIVAYL